MPVAPTTPDRPAAKANGTVNPSDIPITMSRIFSEEVKCVSTCGVCGIVSPLRSYLAYPSVAITGHATPYLGLLGRVWRIVRCAGPVYSDRDSSAKGCIVVTGGVA